MRQDSDMAAYIMDEMTQQDVPVLTVHDSFIVPFSAEDELHRLMDEAFKHFTGKTNIQMKWNGNLTQRQLSAHGSQDRRWYLDAVKHVLKGKPTNGYLRRMERHQRKFDTDT